MPTELLIRDARDEDMPAVQAIYAHHVRYGTATFEVDPPTLAEMLRRRADIVSDGLPYVVAQQGEDSHFKGVCIWPSFPRRIAAVVRSYGAMLFAGAVQEVVIQINGIFPVGFMPRFFAFKASRQEAAHGMDYS